MIKKIIVASMLIFSPLLAKELIVSGQNSMVKTDNPRETKSIYLGSYLAKGYIESKDIFRIDASVEGVVERLNVSIYEPIKKGKLLAVIKSPKMLELEATYINFLIEQEYYSNEVARLKPLYEAKVVAKRQYLKTLNTLQKFQTQTKFYYHLLQQWGLSKGQVDSIKENKKPIPEIKVYAPMDGIINDMNIFPKMYLQRGEHMMTIIDDKNTHLVVSLPLNITKKIKLNQKLFIDDKEVIVKSIAAEIDARTQTVAVHLKPQKGMDIMLNEKKNIQLYLPKNAFKLPSSSVIDYHDKESIFIKLKDGYKLLNVNVLGMHKDHVYIVADGLSSTDEVAVSGVISLKGALEGQDND
ncbi:MAG: efflux RND transporter periplasmic adaptor subunit [Sulfurimonas sp.]|nr:efflux RND transporter periplasmic adaptor subunit [Sulfurimonas sp.]